MRLPGQLPTPHISFLSMTCKIQMAVIRLVTMGCLLDEFMQLSKKEQDILGRCFGVYGFPKSDLREIAM